MRIAIIHNGEEIESHELTEEGLNELRHQAERLLEEIAAARETQDALDRAEIESLTQERGRE